MKTDRNRDTFPTLAFISSSPIKLEAKKKGKNTAVRLNITRHNSVKYFKKFYFIEVYSTEKGVINLGENEALIPLKERFGFLKKVKLGALQKLICFFIYIFELYYVVKKYKIDIIKVSGFFSRGLLVTVFKKLTGIPMVILLNCDYDKCRETSGDGRYKIAGSEKITNLIKSFVLNSADMVFCISEYIKNYAIPHINDEDKLKVIYNGIRIDGIKDKFKQDGSDKDSKTILFVGRLDYENYIRDIIKVANVLVERKIDFVWDVIGDGSQSKEFNELVLMNNLKSYINILGSRDNNFVRTAMNSHAVIFCPYSGFVLIEAAFCYSAVVAYDCEWHKELLEDGVNSFIVEESNVFAAADRIIEFLDNNELRKKFSDNLYLKALKQHDIAITGEIEKKFYMDFFNQAQS